MRVLTDEQKTAVGEYQKDIWRKFEKRIGFVEQARDVAYCDGFVDLGDELNELAEALKELQP